MKKNIYKSMYHFIHVNRRDFLKIGGSLGTGLILGNPGLWAQDKEKPKKACKN
jgi:hypothetical protein